MGTWTQKASSAGGHSSDAAVSQPDKFRDLARELGCDEDEAAWDERLRQVAGHRPASEPDAEPEG